MDARKSRQYHAPIYNRHGGPSGVIALAGRTRPASYVWPYVQGNFFASPRTVAVAMAFFFPHFNIRLILLQIFFPLSEKKCSWRIIFLTRGASWDEQWEKVERSGEKCEGAHPIRRE
jgi:hypothetical protein